MLKIRQTLLNQYETCPRICFLEWGEYGQEGECERERQEHTNKYASVGTALHEVMEWQGLELKQKRKPTLLQLHDLLDVEFNKIPVELFDDEEDKEKYYNLAHEQIDWLYDNFKEMTPLLTEFNFDLPNLIDNTLPFNGTIDRVDGNMVTQDIHLGDYKSGKVYTKKELACNIQAYLYSEAWFKMFGYYPKDFTFYFSRYRKIKTINITEEFLEKSRERVLSIIMHIKNGDFSPPTKPNIYFCKHFCKYMKECPKHKRKQGGWGNVG